MLTREVWFGILIKHPGEDLEAFGSYRQIAEKTFEKRLDKLSSGVLQYQSSPESGSGKADTVAEAEKPGVYLVN